MQVPGFILTHSTIKDEKIWHFYVLLAGWASIYTVMNVSVVLFLNEALGNIFYAGLALSIGCLCSMFFDGLFSSLQKVYSSRLMFMASITGMLVSVFLFFFSFHWAFAFLAAIFFSISYDLCDITATSYILEKSLPAEYGQNLSYKQLAQGVGMIVGFIISSILIAASYFIGDTATSVIQTTAGLINVTPQMQDFISALLLMKIFLALLLLGLLFFTFLLFDRSVQIDKNLIVSSFQKLESDTFGGLKQQAIKVVKNIPGILHRETNQIELQSTENKQSFDFKKVFGEIKTSALDILLIFKKRPPNTSLLWTMGVLGIFSYWDTFLGTFLAIFLTEVLRAQSGWMHNIPGSLAMLALILPVLVFLPTVAKWGDKYGNFYFIALGLLLTTIGCFILGIVGHSSLFLVLIAGYCISFGYLFAMSPVKALMASKTNEFLAVEKQLSSIDTNASAAPMMLINNTGNIIGPLLGSGMIALFGFRGFFFLFALFLGFIFFITLKKVEKISGHAYVFQSPVKEKLS